MALFKVFKGSSANLPSEMHDGYCYFTTDDGKFYIDYLDTDGTTLKRKPISGPGKSIEYIVGTQTASTNAWTGNSKDDELWVGKTIAYKIPYAGTSSAATLALTLSDGTVVTKTLRRMNSSVTTHYPAGTVLFLTYDGTYWQTDGDYDSDSGYYFLRKIYPNIKTGVNKIYPYTFIMQLPDGRWESLVMSSSTSASKTVNPHGFLLGNIYLHYYNGTTYTENQVVSTYSIYSAYGSLIDHRHSFNTKNNATNGTTGYKPVYLVGSLHSDGLFYLDTTKWWTQTLPTSADGKLYIYLGDAYDYYRMVFAEQNPIYQYVNGAIRQFTQDAGTVNGLTVQTAVPQNAVFTDYKVRQTNDTSNTNFRVLLSNSANDTQEDNVTHKNTNLQYNPSTNKLSTGNIDLTGNLAVTGNATFSNETNIASATIGTLQVNGNANFVQSPTAPTPAAATNDTTIATTAFVKNQIAAGVTGVKGNAESSYRVGQVNLTPANIHGTGTAGQFWRGDNTWSDTISGGTLKITYNNDTLEIGSKNASFVHFNNSVRRTFWFSDGLSVQGNITPYGTTNTLDLGTSSARWRALYLGNADTYGSATQPIYWNNGVPKAIDYTIQTSVPSGAVFTDTKNTAGSTQTSGDLFLVGATSQAANPQTYSSSQLKFINSTNTLYTQNAELTGTLVVTGQTTLNDNLSAQGITATDLIVNGATRFNTIPLSVTPEATSNDNSVATTAFVKNAAAGLSGAMHFRGTTTSAIVDGSTTNPITIGGASYTAAAGDVVLREVSTGNVFEYVWTGSAWEMLGRDTSFKVTQTAVTKPTAVTNKWVSAIGQNANGEIDVSYATLDTSGTWSGNAATATKLATARTLKVNLASGNASTAFDGSANIADIGVSGTLPIGNGGTGKTSWTQWGVVYASATTTLTNTEAGATNTALMGQGSAAPAFVSVSPSISITAGTSSAAPEVNVTVLGVSGTAQSITTASTSVYGVTKLNSDTNSTSTTEAATPSAVKSAYDLANNHKYWANVEATAAAGYKTILEVAKLVVNGKTATEDTDTASTKNVQLVYDSTLEVLNFVFS